MYTIYINEKPLILARPEEIEEYQCYNKDIEIIKFDGSFEQIKKEIRKLEKGVGELVVFWSTDYINMKNIWYQNIPVVEAAGGVVVNQYGEILTIFRRGFWDLPKGKLEKDEKKKHAGVREVEEETGISNVTLLSKITKTHHIFNHGEKRKIKRSHWYKMTADKQDLIPQTEEDIEQAKWVDPIKFLQEESPIFNNIKDVVNAYLKMEI